MLLYYSFLLKHLFLYGQSILQVTVESVHDPKVGAIFDPRSLIQALTSLISEEMNLRFPEPGYLTENIKLGS